MSSGGSWSMANVAGRDLVSVVPRNPDGRHREGTAHVGGRLFRRIRRPVRGAARGEPATADYGFCGRNRRLSVALEMPGLVAGGGAGDGEYSAGRDRRGAGAVAHAMAHVRSAARGAVLAMAARVDSGDQPVGRALGRLHHTDRHRQSQRHHDDLALHSPDAVRRREVSTRR